MISERKIIEILHSAEQTKLLFASQAQLSELGQAAITQLQVTRSSGGTIRVLSDRDSRWSAHHFNEELVVRFKAGSEFGRADRPAINSRQYCDYGNSYVSDLIRANRFHAQKDTVVVFASVNKDHDLIAAVEEANNRGFYLIVIAPENQTELFNSASCSFALPTEDCGLIMSLHSTLLHAICEGFEPEYDFATVNFLEVFKSSAEVDKKIATDKDLISLIASINLKIIESLSKGGTLFVSGNGGSTCDANALADFVRSSSDSDGNKSEVIELHAADVILCSYNDGYAPFARQVDANARAGDVLLVYSTSGNSQNVIDAVTLARSREVLTIGLLGKGGGKLASLCEQSIIIPSTETSRIQEAHSLLGRILLSS